MVGVPAAVLDFGLRENNPRLIANTLRSATGCTGQAATTQGRLPDLPLMMSRRSEVAI